MEEVAVAEKKRPGLEVLFTKGESLPWKGLWFEVTDVGHDVLTLKPTGTTWKRHKELQARTAHKEKRR